MPEGLLSVTVTIVDERVKSGCDQNQSGRKYLLVSGTIKKYNTS
jgi:hypothetical protein